MAATQDEATPDAAAGRFSFARQEEEILAFWRKIDAFGNCLKQSEGKPAYTFYDGPPFATGLPHYGHLLAGTIKDIVTRYAHQTGHHVERRAGWDTHGLPVEYEIDKKLGIKSKEQVYEMGVDKYNEECRKIVMRYSGEWKSTVERLGRWIDFENDYKTLYPWYMESIWWVFKEIFNKDMVYRGCKVMPFSTGCHTPLSNFEAGQNYVDDVKDPAVVVSFPLVDDPEVSLVAWTTTPWTLPSNLALCVHPDMVYVKIKEAATDKLYILLEERLSQLYGNNKKSKTKYTVLAKMKGSDLKGKQYEPLFGYYSHLSDSAFRVCNDTYVTASGGTGVVHQAPAFGEDDFRVCMAHGIVHKGGELPCPVDDDGKFTDPITEYKGQYIKDADKHIMKALKAAGRLVQQGEISHRYPYCWRSDTPLIYRAVPSWFIKVEDIRDRLCKNNEQTYWVPNSVREGRFNNWLSNARDWAFSRSRFWGTPIPLWCNSDFSEVVCIGSIEELERRTGEKVTDLHRHFIDHLTIPSEKGGEPLRRIDDVFDCWFESGSMPYASRHFPFENKELFEKGFPADFIAEGIDQTRGWFYTLMVISTILFDKPAFKNLVVNGMVQASDGKKMSKRLKNYPDPNHILDTYGADALRLFLIDSPVVRAEDLKFREDGVQNILKSVFLPWYNANKFFFQNAEKFEADTGVKFSFDLSKDNTSDNVTDRWIYNYTQDLLAFVQQEMKGYRLYTVVPRLVAFVEQLTNWYVRLNRKRIKGASGLEDCKKAMNTLFEVLYTLCKAMAPFTPFMAEAMYQKLKLYLVDCEGEFNESVHYLSFPTAKTEPDTDIIDAFNRLQTVIETGRVIRDRVKKPLKMPLQEIHVLTDDVKGQADIGMLQEYVQLELNVRKVTIGKIQDGAAFGCVYKCTPNERALGKRLKKERAPVMKQLRELTQDQMRSFKEAGEMTLLGHTLTSADVELDLVMETTAASSMSFGVTQTSGTFVLLDTTVNDALQAEKLARELVNRVQRLRWKAKLEASQIINAFYVIQKDDNDVKLADVMHTHRDTLSTSLNLELTPFDDAKVAEREFITREVCDIENAVVQLTLTHP